MGVNRLSEIDINGKVVLIREDLNVPIKDGKITSDARIRAAIPTLQYATEKGARVRIMSHLGRPMEGVAIENQLEFSLAIVAERVSELLGRPVPLVRNWLADDFSCDEDIVLFENTRINEGEKANQEKLSRQMAKLCDVFVMDAFGTAHRAQASTCGVARFAKVACAGPLLQGELDALERALSNPENPLLAVVGGSKVSGKLDVLGALSEKVDQLIVGGGIANTFLAAAGYEIGKSLYEPDLVEQARELLDKVDIPLPVDVITAKEVSATATATCKALDQVAVDDLILDIGPQTSQKFAELINAARTIVWNGPMGVFEFNQFSEGTRQIAEAIGKSVAFSIAGGGDTLAAISQFGVTEQISYISTGGGAFLEFVEGKTLPSVSILQERFTQG